jgi:3-isopropylmalate dehydrogenase
MTESTFNIAVLPGDGIGPEVTAAGVEVLNAVASFSPGLTFTFEEFSIGANEFLKSGDPLPHHVLERIRAFDAILLGAAGLPGVRWPTGVEIAPQIDLRERLDLYCGLRPIYLFHPDDSPLRDKPAGSIDLLLVRESTEGLFSGRNDRSNVTPDRAEDRLVITRHGAERIVHAAFREAMGRRKHLTLVDKANVLPSMAYFRGIFDEIATEFPEVETQRIYVDAAALYLIQRPESFDVLVTENMFGDILSDEMAVVCGSLGMLASASLGTGQNRHGLPFGLYEPAGGTAPDLAGKNLANPCAQILSVALLLRYSFGLEAAAAEIEKAVRDTVTTGTRTGDIAFGQKSVGTKEMGAAILAKL